MTGRHQMKLGDSFLKRRHIREDGQYSRMLGGAMNRWSILPRMGAIEWFRRSRTRCFSHPKSLLVRNPDTSVSQAPAPFRNNTPAPPNQSASVFVARNVPEKTQFTSAGAQRHERGPRCCRHKVCLSHPHPHPHPHPAFQLSEC
jgi:hypothetical protein